MQNQRFEHVELADLWRHDIKLLARQVEYLGLLGFNQAQEVLHDAVGTLVVDLLGRGDDVWVVVEVQGVQPGEHAHLYGETHDAIARQQQLFQRRDLADFARQGGEAVPREVELPELSHLIDGLGHLIDLIADELEHLELRQSNEWHHGRNLIVRQPQYLELSTVANRRRQRRQLVLLYL